MINKIHSIQYAGQHEYLLLFLNLSLDTTDIDLALVTLALVGIYHIISNYPWYHYRQFLA